MSSTSRPADWAHDPRLSMTAVGILGSFLHGFPKGAAYSDAELLQQSPFTDPADMNDALNCLLSAGYLRMNEDGQYEVNDQ